MIFCINFATKITLLRILLTPYIVMTILNNQWQIAFLLCSIAAFTDYLDGYYARRYGQETEFGKMMDPVADKIFVFATLWALHVALGNKIIPTWFMMIVAVKELLLICGALFLIQRGQGVLSPSIYAKWVTALLMILIVGLLLAYSFGVSLYIDDNYMAAIFTLFALSTLGICIDYGYKFYKLLWKVS